jgi:hypothetical protein
VPNSRLCDFTPVENNLNVQVTKEALSLTYCLRLRETLSLSRSLTGTFTHTQTHTSYHQGGLALAQSVTRWLLIANSSERSRSIPRKVCGGRSGKRKFSIRLLRLSLQSKIPPKLNTHLHLSIFVPEQHVGKTPYKECSFRYRETLNR